MEIAVSGLEARISSPPMRSPATPSQWPGDSPASARTASRHRHSVRQAGA